MDDGLLHPLVKGMFQDGCDTSTHLRQPGGIFTALGGGQQAAQVGVFLHVRTTQSLVTAAWYRRTQLFGDLQKFKAIAFSYKAQQRLPPRREYGAAPDPES